ARRPEQTRRSQGEEGAEGSLNSSRASSSTCRETRDLTTSVTVRAWGLREPPVRALRRALRWSEGERGRGRGRGREGALLLRGEEEDVIGEGNDGARGVRREGESEGGDDHTEGGPRGRLSLG